MKFDNFEHEQFDTIEMIATEPENFIDLDIVARKNFINLETHRQTLALKLQQTQQQLQLQQQQHQLQQLQQQTLKKLLQIQTFQNLQKLEEAVAAEKNEVRAIIEEEPLVNTTPAAEAVDVEVVATPAVVEEAKTPIQQFYDKASIFMTGGTGFMGKCMIEKLLRTCTSLECIYLLVRPKKGKDVHTRIDELFEDSLFDIVRETIPKFRHKVIAVPGDCSIAGLGLNLCDRQTLINNVSIVFHAAATVRFDEHLRMAININVHGTRDVLELCNHMEKLKVVMHVSTAYANCHLRRIDEKFYHYQVKFEELEQMMAKLDDKEIAKLTPTILGKWPNTYAFTKALAEDFVRTRSEHLPIGMFRPAIVTSSAREPVVGWIDNLYGPTGVVAGVGTGVLRTMHCDKDINANIVPVDMTVNALLTAAWDTHEKYQQFAAAKKIANETEIPVYNFVSSNDNPLTWGDFTKLNIKYGFEFPFSNAIWYMTFRTCRSAIVNQIYTFFLHILPALLIDSLGLCVGQKPRLIKVYKKIHKFSNVISFFCTNEWTFNNKNVQKLWNKMPTADRDLFYFDMKQVDWIEYSRYYIRGMRIYLFKDDLSTVEAAKRKWNRFYWLHLALKSVISFIILYFFWSIIANFIY